MRLLGGSASPIGWTVSYLQAPLTTVDELLRTWYAARPGVVVGSVEVPSYPTCLDLLEPLTVPVSRELFIDCRGGWTAVVSNHALGGDPSAPAPYLGIELAVRCVVAAHSPRYGPGHGGTQFWVAGPSGKPPLMYERTVDAVAQDGRWTWRESGVASRRVVYDLMPVVGVA